MLMKRRKNSFWRVFRYVVLAVILVVALFPIYFIVNTSLKTPMLTFDPSVWFFTPTFENYKSLIEQFNVFPYMLNSIAITTGSVLLSLLLGAMSAYAFVKYDFKSKESIANWMLSMRFLPAMASIIPLFLIAQIIRMTDNHFFIILAYQTFNIPFAAWMLRGFFEEIPRELEEAALVDGANRWQSLTQIMIPLVRPGLFATSALLVIQTWNEFALAFFLTSRNARTIPTITSQFQTVRGVLWGEMAALGVLTTIPVIFFAILARKYLIRGLTFGAIK